jgi:MoxR-like ATPase
MLKLKIGYPTREEERQILDRMATTHAPTPASPVVGTQEILAARALVDQIYLDDKIKEYIVDLVFATREPSTYKLDWAAHRVRRLAARDALPDARRQGARVPPGRGYVPRRT